MTAPTRFLDQTLATRVIWTIRLETIAASEFGPLVGQFAANPDWIKPPGVLSDGRAVPLALAPSGVFGFVSSSSAGDVDKQLESLGDRMRGDAARIEQIIRIHQAISILRIVYVREYAGPLLGMRTSNLKDFVRLCHEVIIDIVQLSEGDSPPE